MASISASNANIPIPVPQPLPVAKIPPMPVPNITQVSGPGKLTRLVEQARQQFNSHRVDIRA